MKLNDKMPVIKVDPETYEASCRARVWPSSGAPAALLVLYILFIGISLFCARWCTSIVLVCHGILLPSGHRTLLQGS